MTTADYRQQRDAVLDRHEREACLFVASCGVLVSFAVAALVLLGL